MHASVSSVLWYKNTISCLSRHISTWQWPFLRTSCPGIYTVECWGEMSTVYVLSELDLPRQEAATAVACQYQFSASQTVTILESVYGDSPTAGLQDINR